MSATTDYSSVTEGFAGFVSAARALLRLANNAGKVTDLEAFKSFVADALPLVLGDVRRRLPALADRATSADYWLVPDDLLAVAGHRYAENAYTQMMAWAMRPDTHPPSAAARQAAWLSALGVPDLTCEYAPAQPRTQVRTDDGVIDLALQYGPHVVCVEAKTGTSEHDAPSKLPQTVAYPIAVAKAFGVPADGVWMVFVTPDGIPAANPDAVCTTWSEFAMAIIRGLEGFDVPRAIWASYAVLFTHLFGSALRPGWATCPI